MRLRKLELRDAPFMLEWMHDKNIVEDLRTNFLEKTLEDCECFIKHSTNDKANLNVAIVDETDTYMGTVSLKSIKEKSAEFGITVRKCALGKGYAIKAMHEILRIGFTDMGLERIYWCVSPENKRAVRFYDKNNFRRIDAVKLGKIEGYTEQQIKFYIWYVETMQDNTERDRA